MKDRSEILPQNLTIWNNGRSRSRIVILNNGNIDTKPVRIIGTRWLSIGENAAREFKNALDKTSWNLLDEVINGGFTAQTWRKFSKQFALESAEIQQIDTLKIHSFGSGNSRVVLMNDDGDQSIAPLRIGRTSFVALNETSFSAFSRLFNDWTPTEAKAMLKIGGGTYNGIRRGIGRNHNG